MSLRAAAARAETGVPVRKERVRACPVGVEEREGERVRDEAAAGPVDSEVDTRLTGPGAGRLVVADMSRIAMAVG